MMQRALTDVEIDALIPGIKVAGKTGTAEAPGGELHSWFVTFAPADNPEIAVAVLVENGQEGYKSALPIARRMLETYLGRSEARPSEERPNTQSSEPQKESTTQKESTVQIPFQNPFRNPAQGPSQNPGQRPGG